MRFGRRKRRSSESLRTSEVPGGTAWKVVALAAVPRRSAPGRSIPSLQRLEGFLIRREGSIQWTIWENVGGKCSSIVTRGIMEVILVHPLLSYITSSHSPPLLAICMTSKPYTRYVQFSFTDLSWCGNFGRIKWVFTNRKKLTLQHILFYAQVPVALRDYVTASKATQII